MGVVTYAYIVGQVQTQERREKMFSLSSFTCSSSPSAKTLCNSTSIYLLHRNPKTSRVFNTIKCSSSPSSSSAQTLVTDESHEEQQNPTGHRNNYAGINLEETVTDGSGKSRIDSWISSRISGISRARVQSSIRSGLVSVNGRTINKVSHVIRSGDMVNCTISELQPLRAEPEDIPLDIVYEDEHVLVVNKPAHMVVHPAPGNPNGTLVNGILHHCTLPTISTLNSDILSETEDISDEECGSFSSGQSSSDEVISRTSVASVRPGIVHRLDKGTSGLLVVAKNEHSHAQLSEQFKLHTIHRVYMSLTSGVPSPTSGRIEVPIGRDMNNRIRMTAMSGPHSCRHVRYAASRYNVVEVLAGGGSALVEWKLETGRTHQIRAHAKYIGIPLLGDEVYGGTKGMALSLIKPRIPSSSHGQLSKLVDKLERPCLHAFALGFKHPHTGENVRFSCQPPADFADTLTQLRNFDTLPSKK